MELAKLTITPKSSQLEPIKALFNPNSYTISKTVTWTEVHSTSGNGAQTKLDLDAPPLTFGGGGGRTLNLELFFDVTEPLAGMKDVRQATSKIVALTRIESDTGQPPVCEITWGNAGPKPADFPFTGVVTNLTQNFTLFRIDGTPVRAKLTVAFKEYLKPEENKRETDPELTTRLVKRGDTLSSIAAEIYRDPTLWRIIAEANRIDDPRRLEPGQSLTIPQLL